jgi:hypothetical protein
LTPSWENAAAARTTATMIRKLGFMKYRLYSKKTGRNLGTFMTLTAAKKHERQIQFFKRKKKRT